MQIKTFTPEFYQSIISNSKITVGDFQKLLHVRRIRGIKMEKERVLVFYEK